MLTPDQTMRAVVLRGAGVSQMDTVPRPEGSGVLVQVEYCGICGTDLTIHKGAHPRAEPGLIMGHEFVGRVREAAGAFAPGDRVVCYPLVSCGTCEPCRNGSRHVCEELRLYGIDADGGMAEYVRIPEQNLIRIGEDIPGVVASQAEPLAVCLHAARRAGEIAGKDILIVGAGPIGTTLALALDRLGARSTTLMESNAERARRVAGLGLAVLAPDSAGVAQRLRQLGRHRFDVVFECAGTGPAFEFAVEWTGNGGRIVIVSIHKDAASLDLRQVCFGEIAVLGARVYTQEDFADAVRLLEPMKDRLAAMVSSVLELDQAGEAMERLVKGASDLKIVLRVSGHQRENHP